MICKSCGEEINVKMKKALKANECPYCGNAILDKEEMRQFVDLQGILGSQRFTDNVGVDEKIRDKVIRVLMIHMKCIKIKEIEQEEDIVKLGDKPEVKKTPLVPPARTLSNKTATDSVDLVEEQNKMRDNIYREVLEEQYEGAPPDNLSKEDIDAAEDVVFSDGSLGEEAAKAERLKNLAPKGSSSKPIQRIA